MLDGVMVNIGSGNTFITCWHQAITWTDADLLSITHSGTDFKEVSMQIQ